MELTEALLGRIESLNPQLSAFIAVTPDAALADAHRVDAARRRGEALPLDGLALGIKDNIDVTGVATTVGSPLFREAIAGSDAECVARLRAAGAVILGKTLLHEITFGVSCDNPWYGTGRNPWDADRIPGGSSGGSGAAVAADMCMGALGTDTGGSVRIPAALNGVTGLRPTLGSISTAGTFPLSWSLDTIGPLARSVDDVAALFGVMAGYDPADPRSLRPPARVEPSPESNDIRGLRIGVPRDFFFDDLDPAFEDSLDGAVFTLRELGADVRDLRLPGLWREAETACAHILLAEAYAVHGERFRAHPESFGGDVAQRLTRGADITGSELAALYQVGFEWRRALEGLFGDVDLILTPATSSTAPLINGIDTLETSRRFGAITGPWAIGGVPALAVPCGFADGLPVGMQLVAPRWREDLLFRTGRTFQSVTTWHRMRPR
ncbi:amidase [Rhodococcus sp. NCIMB 12038]|uniref:amidase n=1 Tax=Rhodococcus sp. NCIMB 12038 TaxID=933800 RepID=UPI0015C63716|nr:amidase [Rhodococcus sp. NCIMB 12038]